MHTKRLITVLLTALLAVTLFAACADGDGTDVTDASPSPSQGEQRSVLIAYYSDADVPDAATGASMENPSNVGNVAYIAGFVQEGVGGTMHSIASGAAAPDVAGYDVVFIGFPNHAGSVPAAVLTFIADNDLSGKTVVLFGAYGAGDLSGSVRAVTAALPDGCTVLEPALAVGRNDMADTRTLVAAWLAEIEF